MASRAGAVEVKTVTEELLAAWVGWPIRTFEAAVPEQKLGFGWRMFAYKSWLQLSKVDKALSAVVPDELYYNVSITGISKRVGQAVWCVDAVTHRGESAAGWCAIGRGRRTT